MRCPFFLGLTMPFHSVQCLQGRRLLVRICVQQRRRRKNYPGLCCLSG